VPWRLVSGRQYGDIALTVYVKVSALAAREEGCTAKVETLARYLGLSKSAVERGLRQLTTPDPVDHVAEVVTRRRTLPGGTGTSAHRTVRELSRGELYVWLPVTAAETLTPRQLRAYAVLTYAVARRIPLAAADLGQMLHHHTGQAAGTHLGERTARRIITSLAAAGWITVDTRAGHQGRHAYTVHTSPIRPVPHPIGPDTHDGSGADDQDGSLASKEDLSTGSPDQRDAGGPIRRRRDTGSRAVDSSTPNTDGHGSRSARGYAGPGLQLSPRVHDVLEPVSHLLPGIRPYLLRRIAHEIGHQLDNGADPDRLRIRLTHRYASTEAIRDPGRWILGAGLPRHGCALDACESGTLLTPWAPPRPCHVCRPGTRPPAPQTPPERRVAGNT
jgi:hypothetical protein